MSDPILCRDCGNQAVMFVGDKAWCILHAPDPEPAGPPAPPDVAALADEAVFSDAAAVGLASIILDATADVMDADPEAVTFTFVGMATETGMTVDTAAGILLATTALLAGTAVDAEEVRTIATAYRTHADQTATGDKTR